jgi:hypothetical protein
MIRSVMELESQSRFEQETTYLLFLCTLFGFILFFTLFLFKWGKHFQTKYWFFAYAEIFTTAVPPSLASCITAGILVAVEHLRQQ